MNDASDDRVHEISVAINGRARVGKAEARMLLSDFIRHELGLTGTHVGCEHGVCGACTILYDGQPARACLMFAVQAHGHAIETVEGLAPERGRLHPLQEAFREAHGLQCGYCTPGILMTMKAFLAGHPSPSEGEIREALSGNLCRCTGYQHIVEAVKLAAEKLRGETTPALRATPPYEGAQTTPPPAAAPLLGKEGKGG
jgi:carbon-monoxide dehydrogenase small subunit